MAIIEFLLGLSIGLVLLWWQRSRSEARLKKVLQSIQPHVSSPLSSTSQLSFAIAQQQQIQQQLQQQLATYETILHEAPIGYLQVDDENRLIWCNEQARYLLGICQDGGPIQPRLLLELVRSYELDDLIETTRSRGKLCRIDWTFYYVSSDPSDLSEQRACSLRGYGFPLPENQVGIFLENRQEAVTLIQRCDRWASDLAHELKTPLTSIRLVAETLQTRLDPPLQTWVDRLISETIRLSNLVQDLLDLSRLQRDAFHSLHLQTTDLIALIHAVWDSLEPLARNKQIQLDYRGPEQLLLELDKARIHRLLVNLLDNSIKYSPAHESIRIQVSVETATSETAYTKEEQVCLEVIDFGTGFSEKDLPHVFDRFYRADPSRARQLNLKSLSATNSFGSTTPSRNSGDGNSQPDASHQGGSGLGLAIVRQIVEAHQGSVRADNHPDTGGAWLQVYLPYRSTHSAAPQR
ncbi:MAG: ATP-binding protein [Elainellaceae cyanobacterium]